MARVSVFPGPGAHRLGGPVVVVQGGLRCIVPLAHFDHLRVKMCACKTCVLLRLGG